MNEIDDKSIVTGISSSVTKSVSITINYANQTGKKVIFFVGHQISIKYSEGNDIKSATVVIKKIVNSVAITSEKNITFSKYTIGNLIDINNDTVSGYNFKIKNNMIIRDFYTGNIITGDLSNEGDIGSEEENNNPSYSFENLGDGEKISIINDKNHHIQFRSIKGENNVEVRNQDGNVIIGVEIDTTNKDVDKYIKDKWGDFK